MQRTISDELRKRGVAAATIRDALGDWIEAETQRIITALSQSSTNLDELLKIKSDATALAKIKRELETAMGIARTE